MSDVQRELAKALNHHTYVTAKALEALFLREQLREAQRTPTNTNTRSIKILGTNVSQVLNRNPERKAAIVINVGTHNVYLQSTSVANDQALLLKGATIKIESTAPLYAYNVVTATSGELSVIEFTYDITTKMTVPGNGATIHKYPFLAEIEKEVTS